MGAVSRMWTERLCGEGHPTGAVAFMLEVEPVHGNPQRGNGGESDSDLTLITLLSAATAPHQLKPTEPEPGGMYPSSRPPGAQSSVESRRQWV